MKTQSSKVLGHARLHRELEIVTEIESGMKKRVGEREGKNRKWGGKEWKREGERKGRAEAERRQEGIDVREETKALGENRKRKARTEFWQKADRTLGGRSYRSLEKGPVWARAGSLGSLWRQRHCTFVSMLAAVY